MKEFIWKKFIKDHENIKDPIVRSRYTRLTGFMGIAVNTVLCVIKIIIGLTIHSIAIMADGIHDMADSLAASVTLIGANLAKKPADEDHPYGHARSEYIASLVVSGIIMFVGYELLKNSVEKCMHPVESEFSWAIVGFMVFAILLKGSSSLFIIATGKRISSLPVIAAGTDNRNDVITSILILIGMLVHHFTGFDPDGYLGIVMSLFILYSGFTLIRQTVDQLLGARPDPEMVKDVIDVIDFEPFRISLDGMGSFGSLWWIGLKDSPELLRVAKQLRHGLASAGIPFDKKKFRPHITLVRKPSADIEIVPASLIDECKGTSMTVDHISLMRSDRGKRGMIYTEL